MKKLAFALVATLVATLALAGRDSGGTYSKPLTAPNDFVPRTTISSTAMNARLNDLGNEITDSLSRSGKGGMSAPLYGVNGTMGNPTFSFTSEASTGLYREGLNDLRTSVSGSWRQRWYNLGSTVNGTLSVQDRINFLPVTFDAALVTTAYSLKLPASPPASTLPLKLGPDGTLSTAQAQTADLAPSSVTSTVLAANSVYSANIVDGTIVDADIAASTITGDRLVSGALTNDKQSFGTPVASTDVAIKSYVDATFAGVTTTASPATGWGTYGIYNTIHKRSGVVTVMFAAQPSAGFTTTIATVPAGYLPAVDQFFACDLLHASAHGPVSCGLAASTGVITTYGAPTTGDTLFVTITYVQ